MATNFPTSLDSLTNPTASDKLNSVTVPHASQHSTLNDAVEALEAKVGVDGSAVTTSHDYLIDKQSVVPYADASARTTAVPSPVEGQMSYLEDTNSVEVYDGSAWTAVGGGVGTANFTDTETGTYSSGGTNYKYLTFTASGTLTVDTAGLADILVIGGGGGSSHGASAGGGAGGYLDITGAYLPVGTLTVVVGAGGAGGPATGGVGLSGQNGTASRLDNYYAVGGGASARIGAGATTLFGGWLGGSGGGACDNGTGGPGTSGQGNDGGDGPSIASGTRAAAGGGGAGTAGSDAVSNTGGNGGNGLSSSITGSAVTRAGGGGGMSQGGTAGTGGTGGGGDGSATASGTAGTANTGGGAGGSDTGAVGVAGGSGIVIVRVEV